MDAEKHHTAHIGRNIIHKFKYTLDSEDGNIHKFKYTLHVDSQDGNIPWKSEMFNYFYFYVYWYNPFWGVIMLKFGVLRKPYI